MKIKLIIALALLAASTAAKNKLEPSYVKGTAQVESVYNGNWTDTTSCAEKPFGGFNCSGGITEDTTKHYFLLLPDHVTLAAMTHEGTFNMDLLAACEFSCPIFYRIGKHDSGGAEIFIFTKQGSKESKYYLKFATEQVARFITNLASTLQRADADLAAGKQ